MVNVFSEILEDFGGIGRAILGFLQSPDDELEIFLFKLDSRKRFIKNHKSFFFTEPPGIEAKLTPTGQRQHGCRRK